MANRVEIGEIVENATGLNITGANVTVRFHGGAQAPVYDAENGGAQITQPIATVNGKIGADYPSGAWVAEGDYDLDVVFGGDTLTFFWPARRATQFVTTLPAGVGTSAPEDGERAIELYDGVNGGAWMRRYRASVSAWDMIGGPPPAGGSLPGTPRARQEFYLTGSTPPIQHMRYNGASWDYVGTPPTVPVTGSPLSILETGQSGHHRAGRTLTLADFSTLCALPTTPVLLANLTTLTSNLGSGGALVNKGTVTNGNGIDGSATAAQFTGSTAQALYIVDTGAADPFRIKTGSFGCWFKTAKRSTLAALMSKYVDGAATRMFWVGVGAANVLNLIWAPDGTTTTSLTGTTDVCDDRWHHVAVTHDGTTVRMYVDGVLEIPGNTTGPFFGGTAPFNIGGYSADAGTVATLPWFGRIDEAFVTPDVLSDDQVRLLYAASFPHGYATTPTRAELSIRRKRRGADWVTADFPSQPVRNYGGGSLTDLGSGAKNLTAVNTPLLVAGVDGTKDKAYNFISGSSQMLTADDTGLGLGATAAATVAIWFKTATATATNGMFGWGSTSGTNSFELDTSGPASGNIRYYINGAGVCQASVFTADGLWHLVVAVLDGNDANFKRKLYLDGRLLATDNTAIPTVALGGAAGIHIGRRAAASTEYFTGQIGPVAIHTVALTAEQIQVLYQKSSQALASSIKSDAGANIEAIDATNIYWIGDTIDSNNTIDLAVAS